MVKAQAIGSARDRSRHELATIVREHRASLGRICPAQGKVVRDIERCCAPSSENSTARAGSSMPRSPLVAQSTSFVTSGRYTHRIAISNQRILKASDETVTFATRHGQKKTLPAIVFLRRFLQHVVPERYVRIRHYGLCAPANVHSRLARARQILEQDMGLVPRRLRQTPEQDFRELLVTVTGVDLRACPACSKVTMQRLALPRTRAPPT